jgi:voltage-gated potassium channel
VPEGSGRTIAPAPVDSAVPVAVHLPQIRVAPVAAIGRRVLIALGLVLMVTIAVFVDRNGYVDDVDGEVTLLDAFYYSTVSITTTGYGDITPVTDRARLITAFVVTPARVMFLILLVGTTLEILTERTRHAWRVRRWRKTLQDHVIICGFGTKGQSAAQTLIGQGTSHDDIVVIDTDDKGTMAATLMGMTAITGDATRTAVLNEAGIGDAKAVVVAPSSDDTSVLMTLTARELNPKATIVSAVREKENVHLLRQSGSDSVITSAEASGRLLGLATANPALVDLLEDLLTTGEGVDLQERDVRDHEVGGTASVKPGQLLLAVIRDGERLTNGDPRVHELAPGDRLVLLCEYLE